MTPEFVWDDLFGEVRFMPWSKENELWRTFYRTTVAGHWSKEDIDEFNSCAFMYEIHLQHGNDDAAHHFCLMIMQRCENFKAAKVSKIAVNDMKVIILLGKSKRYRDRVANAANVHGFELARIRDRDAQPSEHERHSHEKIGEYLESLRKAFAPMATARRPNR